MPDRRHAHRITNSATRPHVNNLHEADVPPDAQTDGLMTLASVPTRSQHGKCGVPAEGTNDAECQIKLPKLP